MQQQFEGERRRYVDEQERVEKDLRSTEADLRRVLSELQVQALRKAFYYDSKYTLLSLGFT